MRTPRPKVYVADGASPIRRTADGSLVLVFRKGRRGTATLEVVLGRYQLGRLIRETRSWLAQDVALNAGLIAALDDKGGS